jgi:hypothetical protein
MSADRGSSKTPTPFQAVLLRGKFRWRLPHPGLTFSCTVPPGFAHPNCTQLGRIQTFPRWSATLTLRWIFGLPVKTKPKWGHSILNANLAPAGHHFSRRERAQREQCFRYRGSDGVEPATHARAHSRSIARSRALRVSDAARSNSARASPN